MPYLSKKRVWTQQPQYVVEKDASSALYRGAANSSAIFVGNNSAIAKVNGAHGVASSFNGTNQYAAIGGMPVVSETTMFMLVRFRSGITSTKYSQTTARNDISGYSLLGFNYDHADLSTFHKAWQCYRGNTFYPCAYTKAINTTDYYLLSATVTASQLRIYHNADLDSTTAVSGAAPTPTGVFYIGCGTWGEATTAYLDADIVLAGEIPIAMPDSWHRELVDNPWKLLKKQDKRIWVPSAGGGGVHTTTSILTSDVATISGTSLHKILHTGVGNLTSSAATLTGTSVHTTPAPTHDTVGVLSASNSSITGIAARYREHQTTGILTTTNATINGTTNNFSVITSTGVLSSNVATLAGVMSITPAPGIHISTGVLQSNSSTITGILTHTATGHTLTGTLVSSVATLNGNVAHNTIHSSSGTLVSSVATINGTASSSGIMTLTPADIEAIANAVWQHPWALTLPKWLALK